MATKARRHRSRPLRVSWEAVASIVTRVVAEQIDDARLDELYRIGVDAALDVPDREFEHRWTEMSRHPGNRQRLRRKGQATYRLIRYADDFVVMVNGTRAQAEAILAELPGILSRIGLSLSSTKTRLTHIDGGFCFLVFRIIRRPRKNKKPCVYTFVSDEALASIKRKVNALTSRGTTTMSLARLIRALNPVLRG